MLLPQMLGQLIIEIRCKPVLARPRNICDFQNANNSAKTLQNPSTGLLSAHAAAFVVRARRRTLHSTVRGFSRPLISWHDGHWWSGGQAPGELSDSAEANCERRLGSALIRR
jgi:hypothetical protein